jgi:hypothetical protein
MVVLAWYAFVLGLTVAGVLSASAAATATSAVVAAAAAGACAMLLRRLPSVAGADRGPWLLLSAAMATWSVGAAAWGTSGTS